MTLDLYESDYYAWTFDQAARVRLLAQDQGLDVELLADEIEDLGRLELRACEDLTESILKTFLKIQFSGLRDPFKRWCADIEVARMRLEERLTPTIRIRLSERWNTRYQIAQHLAAKSLPYPIDFWDDHFPPNPPYTLDQVTNPVWFPEPRELGA